MRIEASGAHKKAVVDVSATISAIPALAGDLLKLLKEVGEDPRQLNAVVKVVLNEIKDALPSKSENNRNELRVADVIAKITETPALAPGLLKLLKAVGKEPGALHALAEREIKDALLLNRAERKDALLLKSQNYLNELLKDFTFKFPQPFFHSKDNNSIEVSGIPFWNENSEKTDYCICVNMPQSESFESIRKFKATITANEPSGKIKTLEINGSETIDASEIEANSVCLLQIIVPQSAERLAQIEKDTILSNEEAEAALRAIFGHR